jgi:hypothetical protein
MLKLKVRLVQFQALPLKPLSGREEPSQRFIGPVFKLSLPFRGPSGPLHLIRLAVKTGPPLPSFLPPSLSYRQILLTLILSVRYRSTPTREMGFPLFISTRLGFNLYCPTPRILYKGNAYSSFSYCYIPHNFYWCGRRMTQEMKSSFINN